MYVIVWPVVTLKTEHDMVKNLPFACPEITSFTEYVKGISL